MAFELSLCLFLEILVVSALPTRGEEHSRLSSALFGNDSRYQVVVCSWRNSNTLAGITLYDMHAKTDIYVSVNSKNECKTKRLLAKCELTETWASLSSVIPNPSEADFRIFACSATWFAPEQTRKQIEVNISHIPAEPTPDCKQECGPCFEWAVPVIVLCLVVAAFGWLLFFYKVRKVRPKKKTAYNSPELTRIPLQAKFNTSDKCEGDETCAMTKESD